MFGSLINLTYGPRFEFFIQNTVEDLKRSKRFDDIKIFLDKCGKSKIKDSINDSRDPNIKILLASHLNKPIMKNIMDIQRKRNIWKYVFNWLTKPITNDGLLGIDARLGLKSLNNLDYVPLTI